MIRVASASIAALAVSSIIAKSTKTQAAQSIELSALFFYICWVLGEDRVVGLGCLCFLFLDGIQDILIEFGQFIHSRVIVNCFQQLVTLGFAE